MRKFTILLMLLLASSAQAARIKDVAQVAGVRNNKLVGYGLVIGLPFTGESTPLLIKALTPCCKVSAFNCLPALSQNQNVAAVIVTADLPAFSKQGQTIDITVSLIGSAKVCVAVP